jgi:hypothetical protein
MTDDPPSPHGLATFAQALCIDCSPEVERKTLRIVKQIKPEEPVADASIAAAASQA